MGSSVLEIRNLSKSYGQLKAVDELNLSVSGGEVWGVLGPNGSGKTTTLGILLDIVKPDSGSFSWFGSEEGAAARKRIGSLLESPVFYAHLSVINNMKIVADIKQAGYDTLEELLKQVGLWERRNSKFKTLSLGMKQRLGIAAALVGDPEVLVLDEPTNGLDPKGIAEIRSLVKEIASKGITIILASHLLDEVQKICSHVVVLSKGKVLGIGEVSKVLASSPALELSAKDQGLLKKELEASGRFSEIVEEKGMLVARMKEYHSSEKINRELVSKGIFLTHLAERKQSLEKYFLDLITQSDDRNS